MRPDDLLGNTVYSFKKLHEIRLSDEKASRAGKDEVLDRARRRLASYRGLAIGGLVLDVGCGRGPDLLALSLIHI